MACAVVLVAPGNSAAQELISISSDLTLELGAGLVATDQDVILDNQLGVVLLENVGALPATADVIGFGADVNGDRLLAFDTTVELPGNVVARPGDVVRFDGSSFQIEFDSTAAGLARGIATDAVSIAPNGGLLLSFDTTAALPGGVVAADEDLVTWSGASYSLVFDGSAQGLEPSLDVDGGQALGGGAFAVSFDTAGVIGGIVFSDEDILRFDGTSWSLEYDASAVDSDWIAADLDAVLVPEPGMLESSLLGGLFVMLIGLRSQGRRSRPSRTLKRVRLRRLAAMGLLLCWTPCPAAAIDGVLEINQTCATITGCFGGAESAGFPVSIRNSTPGKSFRLTSDLVVPDSANGISINTDFATIDLNGFRIVRSGCENATAQCSTAAGSGSGVETFGGALETTVKNGSVIGMGFAGLSLKERAHVSNVTVKWCGLRGIFVGRGSTLTGNYVFENGLTDNNGIFALGGSVITGNTVVGSGGHGIGVSGEGSVISENSVRLNGLDGIHVYDGASVVSGNIANNNGGVGIAILTAGTTVSGNTANKNGTDGIRATAGSTVIDNTAFENGANGLNVQLGTSVQRNNVRNNGDLGLLMSGPSAYRENMVSGNAGGTVLGGTNLGSNSCNGTSSCP